MIETKINRTIDILDKIYLISKRYLSTFNNSSFNDIEKILGITILENITGNLNAIKILLNDIRFNPNIDNAIGLILRNNLSLCKIVIKHSEIKDSSEDLECFYKNVFGDNLKRTICYIKKYHTDIEIQECIEGIKKQYSYILRSTNINIDNIENENFNANLKLSSKFYSLENLFIAFSKYEHFGLNTLILHENDDEEKLNRINIATHYSLQGVIICLSLLEIKDNVLINLNKNFNKGTKAQQRL